MKRMNPWFAFGLIVFAVLFFVWAYFYVTLPQAWWTTRQIELQRWWEGN